MNAARRTMLSVFTAAGLSGVLVTPSIATLAYGLDTSDTSDTSNTSNTSNTSGDLPVGRVGSPPGASTPVGADQREIRTHQRQLQVSLDNVPPAPLALQPVALVQTTAPLRASRSRSLTAGGPDTSPQQYARTLLAEQGQGDGFGCLTQLWERESGWSASSRNRTSGAYGIPQALPASKMASAGADWRTNPATQVRWGIGYIADRYGDPCSALQHSSSFGWY